MLEKLKSLLTSINSKKEQMTKLQKEVEIKIGELDKLLDDIQKTDNPRINKNHKP